MTTPPQSPDRSAGILLHPTSLPGPFGIGDLGPAAFGWIDALARARQKWWQVLPLGPTGFGDSPYQAFSAFAGNPYLVSPELLLQDGLLQHGDLVAPGLPAEQVDFGPVIEYKVALLNKAWENYLRSGGAGIKSAFEEFCGRHASWLEDFALYMALKDAQGGRSWLEWPADLCLRQPAALDKARKELKDQVGLHRFRQFLFFRQWQALKQYAHQRGIRYIGDVPIFVSSDSCDVWANRELFLLDERGRPRVVSGVPPDYFSRTGQLWGNPLYDWPRLRQTNYAWWVARLRTALELVDIVRLDHFRGFEAYWEIPANLPTAEVGRWVPGPGSHFFTALRTAFGGLPLIAEDLGIITPPVEALREQFTLPGMRVLQFAFMGDIEPRFLPHNYDRHTVVYTGTHDNDTTRGWYACLSDREKHYVRRYLGRDDNAIAWDLIRLAWSSVADYAIAPLQDVLNLGTEARMNLPGRPAGNWGWRFTKEMLTDELLDRLGDMTEVYGR